MFVKALNFKGIWSKKSVKIGKKKPVQEPNDVLMKRCSRYTKSKAGPCDRTAGDLAIAPGLRTYARGRYAPRFPPYNFTNCTLFLLGNPSFFRVGDARTERQMNADCRAPGTVMPVAQTN